MSADRIPPPRVSQEVASGRATYFTNVQLWPTSSVLNVKGWLSNFGRHEREYAANLLSAFVYLNSKMVNALLTAAVHGVSQRVVGDTATYDEATDAWEAFLDGLVVTYVEGESPNPTDSGYAFARKARQVLGIPQQRIQRPDDALEVLAEGKADTLLFVDDFVGSGSQMQHTWARERKLKGGADMSFREVSERGVALLYCPLVSTSYGMAHLRIACPGLVLIPAHELGDEESLVHPRSAMWPESLRDGAVEFLYGASERAGIVAERGDGWQGFHNLGLAIAFEDSVPDATLPLYYWERNGWVPLVRRS